MNELLEHNYRTGTVTSTDGQELQALTSGVSRALAEVLYRIMRANNLRRTLEVGMAFGLSSLAVCQVLCDNGGRRHVAIDPLESSRFKSVGMLNLKRTAWTTWLSCTSGVAHLSMCSLTAYIYSTM
jgi:hypothetical protein